MKRVLLTCLLLLLAVPAQAQLWAPIIDPTRATDWSYAGVPGGIPNRTNNCYGPGGSITSSALGPTSTVAQINTAIQNCSDFGGGVVNLLAGNFGPYSSSITFSPNHPNPAQNVTLRGAGADQTIITFTGQGATGCSQGGLVCVGSWISSAGVCTHDSNTPNTANWTANYAAGSTTIVLDNVSANCLLQSQTNPRGCGTDAHVNLEVGAYVYLDQLDNPNTDFALYRPFVTSDPTYAYLPCNAQRNGSQVPGRCLGAHHKVVAITPALPAAGPYTVTITPPLAYRYWNINGNNQPGAWWCQSKAELALGNGVENLTVNNQTGQTSNSYGLVQFSGAAESWMKGVKQVNAGNAHVLVEQSSNIEIRDSYIYGTLNGVGCGVNATQYGIDPANAGWLKVENNIFQQTCSALQTQPCYTCVYSYNYTVGDLPQRLDGNSALNGTFAAANYLTFWSGGPGHVGGNYLHLYEGNDLNAFSTDHGVGHGTNAMLLTAYRNRFSGFQPADPLGGGKPMQNRVPVAHQADNRLSNYVGNVLGHPSMVTAGWLYQSYPGFGTDPNVGNNNQGVLYSIGWSGGNGTLDDVKTKDSLLRWRNWDFISARERFCTKAATPAYCAQGAEVPTDNFDPSTSATLPASVLYASKPAWFGSNPWPAIGPDITGGNDATDTSGHTNMIPAKACYVSTMHGPADGSGAALAFNAATCYGSGGTTPPPDTTPPGIPQNLRIVQ
jgi:hypothetical protein